MKHGKILLLLLVAAFVLTGCSDVRMNAAYIQKTLDVQTVVCQAASTSEKIQAFPIAQTYWKDVYEASKTPWPFGKVYLSASYSEWVQTHLGELNVDCRAVSLQQYTDEQMELLLVDECKKVGGILNAARGMKGGE